MTESSFIVDLKAEQNTFREQLNQLRKDEKFTDVELKVGDKLFPAHRAVLSLYSPFIEAIISDRWSPTSSICSIGDEYIDPEIMEDLLSFFYTGSIHLTSDNVHSVCVAAHYLQIPRLLELSVQRLCQLITEENVLTLYAFSINCELEPLYDVCFWFIIQNYDKVLESSQILEFPFKNFKDLIVELRNHTCSSVVREQTFKCIIRWTEKNLSERWEELPVLLENIPLQELPYDFFSKTVSTHSLVKGSISCASPIFNAFLNFEIASMSWWKESQDLYVVAPKKVQNIQEWSIFCISPEVGVCKPVPDMITTRHSFALVTIGRNIIVSGGQVGFGPIMRSTDSVEMFDSDAQTWRELPKMPLRLGSHMMVVHKGDLYVVGGQTDYEPRLKSVFRFSFKTKRWKFLKSMNIERSGGHLISDDDYLYAIGGNKNSIERYDTLRDHWTEIPSGLWFQNYFGATVHQDKFYTCGSGGFDVFDPETNSWQKLPQPVVGCYTSLLSINNKLLAVGGALLNQTEMSDIIYEYDFRSYQWKELYKLPYRLTQLRSVIGAFYFGQ